ncbi:glycoside hydrolase family 127 protein [Deinococcus alpinitundrae]|uniref:glycoside hydrolase family 127 protein n=1 Tax=Deinococcus alpinitundrae TaxID=468913 RepID=UPI001379886B|nr:beta-L-arabinofuranosidase domain-containing protein [Deinococcus alpinitundrae]
MTTLPRPDAAPVFDTARSPHARLHPVGLGRVRLTDTFLEPRRRTNRDVTLLSQYRHLEDTHTLRNFRRVTDGSGEPFVGYVFNDTDVYKWLEAAAWTLAEAHDPALEGMIAEAAKLIEGAQDTSGYLDTYYSAGRENERWSDLKDNHELYCAGHFIQAAVAHHRTTGREQLLNVARRLADHIGSVFGPVGEGKRELTDGHEEIELALVELYRETGEKRYLELAQFLIEVRGRGVLGADEGNHTFNSTYYQDHLPVREMNRVVGHAVRMMYLTTGVTDLYLENGDPSLLEAMQRLWTHMTTRQMYVSGGLGARYEGEAFGDDFELPNARAYTETCAAIGSVMWNARLLTATGEAKYADLLEHTFYNAVLPGWSLGGEAYFYQNPLADEGHHRRKAWFGCACCPPNVARLMASLPGYVYGTAEGEVWVNLYVNSEASVPVLGQEVKLTQRTDYPWNGKVELTVGTAAHFALKLRIPAWAEGASLSVNGEALPALRPGTYTSLERDWQAGDSVTLDLPMPIRKVRSHPRVLENVGRVALLRGPLLYALEGVDHPGTPLDDLVLPPDAELSVHSAPELLGSVLVLEAEAQCSPRTDGDLYGPDASDKRPVSGNVRLRAVPYYAWANREPGQLRVWIREA